jgi:hypothetical protein
MVAILTGGAVLAKRAKKAAKAPLVPKSVGGQPVIEVTESTPQFYANFIEITNSPWDFSLIFGTLPSKLNRNQVEEIQATGTIPVQAQLTVNFPPTLLAGLIRALTTQKELYEKAMGTELIELQMKDPG